MSAFLRGVFRGQSMMLIALFWLSILLKERPASDFDRAFMLAVAGVAALSFIAAEISRQSTKP